MKRSITLLFCVCALTQSYAQSKIDYDKYIQPILQKNCVTCHRAGGIGPFRLDNYEDVAKRAKFIAKVTAIKYMPPFPADRSFQHYANERGLADAEIETIQKWANQLPVISYQLSATPRSVSSQTTNDSDSVLWRHRTRNGKWANQLPVISYQLSASPRSVSSQTSRHPDFTFQMQQPFTIPNTAEEEFRYFYVPTHLKKDIYVSEIEFLPSNRKVLHHSRVMVDTSGRMTKIEGIRADDPALATFQQIPMADQFLYGWVPGNDRIKFPKGIAKKVKANSNLVMNLHYSPSAKIQTDQSKVNFYVSKQPVEREVKSLILTEENISNQPFLIKADTKPTFYMTLGPIQQDISAISVMPHLHWLGKTFKAFAITPDGDFVPLVKIDNWDFNWQMTYQFQTLLHIPKGSTIMAEATFDNTSDNLLNPFKPARDITYGWNSTAEMLEMVVYFVPYRTGDELIKQ